MNDSFMYVKPVEEAIENIDVTEKLVNGSQLLLIYYGIIAFFFITDILLTIHPHSYKDIQKIKGPIRKGFLNLYFLYRTHGLIVLNSIILFICIALIIYYNGLHWGMILAITISIAIFTIFMRIVLRIFVNKDSYEDEATIRSINLICYIILGNFFCYFMRFISTPDLRISLSGLTLALLLCFYIMTYAIFNPKILQKSASTSIIYTQAFGIIKGMFAVLVCMLATLYMMIYCCYVASPAFFATSAPGVFDYWDLLYYLVISFTTIGYGDIVPVRYGGMFYSRYAAIMIAVASIFTTTCFVAAVISTTNSIAKSTRERVKKNLGKDDEELTDEEIRRIIQQTIKEIKKKEKEE